MAAGSLAGALLGALDLLTMVQMAKKAAALNPNRASALVRRVALGRMALVFGALALGAMVLGQTSFLCMAAAYIVVRLGGLFVIAARSRAAWRRTGVDAGASLRADRAERG
ncbi:MAG TPA: hypothetical protein GX515_03660 [Firmicutes bacterium]|nr:hypothetical protein [Bacillota bacterium]